MSNGMRFRDPDKNDVYYAERMTFVSTLFDEPMSSDDFMRLAERLFTHEWWVRSNVPVPVIEPAKKRDKTSYAAFYPNDIRRDPIIRILPHDINAWVLAHEASHIAQFHFYKPGSYGKIESHGREFRATYLRIVEIVLGRDAADDLRANFDTYVRVRPKHAPGMPGSIMTVPRPRPEWDPSGMGLYPLMRLEQQKSVLDSLPPVTSFVTRINGAIAL